LLNLNFKLTQILCKRKIFAETNNINSNLNNEKF
jgi:hypothetical protein